MTTTLKTYEPDTLEDQPFPGQQQEVTYSPGISPNKTNYSPETVRERDFPRARIATELLGQALNTQSRRILAQFSFTKKGSLQIGEYQNGISGDIRISPNGITARDSAGNTTVSIDGTTGDATFKGQIQSGSLVTGVVSVGNDDVVIDGANQQMIFYNSGIPAIVIGKI